LTAVARPDVREITNGVYFPVSGECGFRGNPRLQRALIYNADAKWEFFPSPTELVSVSGYYKYFSAPIVPVASGNAGSRCEFSVTNAVSAEVSGAEFEFRKRLAGPLGVSFNFALVQSEARLDPNDPFFGVIADSLSPRLQNQSPFIVNAALTWDDYDGGLNAAVFLNYFGDRITEYGASGRSGDQAFIIPDRIEQGRVTLDAKVKKRLGPRLGVTLAGQNLTNNTVLITQELFGSEQIVGQFQQGINVSFGVSYGL
jgi:outer membrane receptor protein involved in Fe transport